MALENIGSYPIMKYGKTPHVHLMERFKAGHDLTRLIQGFLLGLNRALICAPFYI